MEEWKVIPYAPIYKVSNMGRVVHIATDRELKYKLSKTGYFEVGLYSNELKRQKFYYVHRIVADLFCPKPYTNYFCEVVHADGNRLNNCYENLCWVVRKYNTLCSRNKYNRDARAVYCKEIDRTFDSTREAAMYVTVMEHKNNVESTLKYLNAHIVSGKALYGKYTFSYVQSKDTVD